MPIEKSQGGQGSEGTSDSRTMEELQEEAKRVGISGFGMMNKSDLIKALQSYKQHAK